MVGLGDLGVQSVRGDGMWNRIVSESQGAVGPVTLGERPDDKAV